MQEKQQKQEILNLYLMLKKLVEMMLRQMNLKMRLIIIAIIILMKFKLIQR